VVRLTADAEVVHPRAADAYFIATTKLLDLVDPNFS